MPIAQREWEGGLGGPRGLRAGVLGAPGPGSGEGRARRTPPRGRQSAPKIARTCEDARREAGLLDSRRGPPSCRRPTAPSLPSPSPHLSSAPSGFQTGLSASRDFLGTQLFPTAQALTGLGAGLGSRPAFLRASRVLSPWSCRLPRATLGSPPSAPPTTQSCRACPASLDGKLREHFGRAGS